MACPYGLVVRVEGRARPRLRPEPRAGATPAVWAGTGLRNAGLTVALGATDLGVGICAQWSVHAANAGCALK